MRSYLFDTRPAVKEEINSLGGEFLELDFEEDGTGSGGYAKVMSKEFIEAEMQLFAEQAEVGRHYHHGMIPGKKNPLADYRRHGQEHERARSSSTWRPRAENCELTEPGEAKVFHGVHVLGYTDFAIPIAHRPAVCTATISSSS